MPDEHQLGKRCRCTGVYRPPLDATDSPWGVTLRLTSAADRRRRVPVMGLARWQRARGGVTPPLDPIDGPEGSGNVSNEMEHGRLGHGRCGNTSNPRRGEEVTSPPAAGQQWSDACAARGLRLSVVLACERGKPHKPAGSTGCSKGSPWLKGTEMRKQIGSVDSSSV